MEKIGRAKASRLSFRIAPPKTAIPIIGLKLCGYMTTLEMAAAKMSNMAIRTELVDCLCIFRSLLQKYAINFLGRQFI